MVRYCGALYGYASLPNMNYDTVIDHFGSAYQLAKALGCRPAAVYHWKGQIPKGRVKEIQRLMKRPWVPKGDIRPQLRVRTPRSVPYEPITPDQG